MFGYVAGEMQFYIQLIMFNFQPFNSDLSIHEGVLLSKCNEYIYSANIIIQTFRCKNTFKSENGLKNIYILPIISFKPSVVLNCEPDCVVHQSDHVSRYFVVCETVAEKIRYL